MRISWFALFIITNVFFTEAQSISESTKISLLTGSPGADLYSTFGHSAIRIKDPQQNLDIVFNYGTFDFNTQNFYLKFVQGQLNYMLSIQNFENFAYSFQYENRSIVEQELDLTIAQKRKIFFLLNENYKPENRNYHYDFFYDNCATRIRDIIQTAFGDDFQYNYPDEWASSKLTFRNLIDLYLTHHHWSDFGIDIALGLPTDAIARPTDYMFLPDNLKIGFEMATILKNGKRVPFTTSKKVLVSRKDIEPDVFFITPGRLMWVLFILSVILSIFSIKIKKSIHWFDVMYFSLIGIVGWVVFLLWFFTDHLATKDNYNLLWAIPFHFPLFIFWNKISDKIKKWYLWIFGIVYILLLVLWQQIPQYYHFAFIPMILIMLQRIGFILSNKN